MSQNSNKTFRSNTMCPATFSLGVLRRGGRGINRLCRDQLVNNLDIRHVNKILPRNCKFTVYFIIISSSLCVRFRSMSFIDTANCSVFRGRVTLQLA